MHDETIDLIVTRLNSSAVRDMHVADFDRAQVEAALERLERGQSPHTPLEAAIQQFMQEFKQ